MVTPASSPTEQRALTDFHELLRAACEGHPPSRPQSVLYQSCRATLLGGSLAAFLPGFVRQCASIERFREFIQLYDRDPAIRSQFVDGALAASWAKLGRPPLERGAAPPSPPSRGVAPPPPHIHVAAPPARAIEDADGFMDDPDDPEDDRARGAYAPGPLAPVTDIFANVVPSRVRGAH